LDEVQNSTLHSFGRQFSSACDNQTTQIIYSCVVKNTPLSVTLMNVTEGIKLLSNQSSENRIITSAVNDVKLSLISDVSLSPSTDFQAETFAVNVECKPYTTACKWDQFQYPNQFNCSSSLQGQLMNQSLYVDFASDNQFANPIYSETASSNPFYFGIATFIGDINGDGYLATSLQKDPEMLPIDSGAGQQGFALALNCQITTYDVQYTYSNGSVVTTTLSKTDTTKTNTFLAPFIIGGFAEMYISNALKIATISNTTEELANDFASNLGPIVLAASAGVMQPADNLVEQTRTQILVTRMPKAPFYTLVAANLLYVLFGLALITMACLSHPREGYPITQMLTAEGLALVAFEPHNAGKSVESMHHRFEEAKGAGHSTRIGLTSRKTSWQYAIWAGPQSSGI
jgi:hypothetical protein